ncbi:MAG: type II toxin-antitoxin system HicA family toxin [Gammaproteobacteria bacterium]|nr:MAG: type II toxin-antitoxin system HicA family toxin [Gammaproteobacteria bacterium]
MGKSDKLRRLILSGSSDANIEFKPLCNFLSKLGFNERIRGDHHIFTKNDVDEILNIQPLGSKAKPYQVKQVRNLIVKYHLGGHDAE